MAGDAGYRKKEDGVLLDGEPFNAVGVQPFGDVPPGLRDNEGGRDVLLLCGLKGVQMRNVSGPGSVMVIPEPFGAVMALHSYRAS